MIEWIEIPRKIVELASSIFDFVNEIQAEEKDRRLRVAETLGEIAECIERIVEFSRRKDWNTIVGNCEELGVYLQKFSKIDLGPLFGNEDKTLLKELEDAVRARRGMLFAWNFYDNKPKTIDANIAQLEKAAGTFRAARNLIRATT